MKKITNKLLEDSGWKDIHFSMPEPFEHLKILIDPDVYYTYKLSNGYLLTLMQECTLEGRDWVIHVDNERSETVGCCPVDTTEHVEQFLKLIDIIYEFSN